MLGRLVFTCVVVGAVAMAVGGCGGSDGDAANAKYAHLYQSAPGSVPVIRMGWGGNISDPALVVAWLIYRGTSPGTPAEPYSLVDAIAAQKLTDYSDTGGAVTNLNFNLSFTYTDPDGQNTGTVNATYSRTALVPGTSYYYRARRVVKPNNQGVPTAQVGPAQATTFSVTPPEALGEASSPQGPVTYFRAAQPTLPAQYASSIDPRSVTFKWDTTVGADEYQVRVYKDSSVKGLPTVQSPTVAVYSSMGQWTYPVSGSGSLQGGRTYYWVVCARRSGEAPPSCGTESGWVKSAPQQFTTVTLPPGGP
jgi:hypothetical protein